MLDPEAKAFLDAVAIPPFHSIGVDEARALSDAGGAGRPRPLAAVDELTVPGGEGKLRARLYRPDTDATAPLLVFFHGGGFVVGSLESHDRLTRDLAHLTGANLIAIDYRLAPKHPFPAAVDDAYAATAWAAAHAADLGSDPNRLAVVGDSAGGNLSAVVAQRSRDEGGPWLAAQALLYPVTAHVTDDPSMQQNRDAPLLPVADVQWYQDLYLADPTDVALPYASPLRAASFAGLPPAVVVTAGADPLRDQGDEYARRLADAGVAVTHLRYDHLFHGFLSFAPVIDAAARALDEVAAALRDLLE